MPQTPLAPAALAAGLALLAGTAGAQALHFSDLDTATPEEITYYVTEDGTPFRDPEGNLIRYQEGLTATDADGTVLIDDTTATTTGTILVEGADGEVSRAELEARFGAEATEDILMLYDRNGDGVLTRPEGGGVNVNAATHAAEGMRTAAANREQARLNAGNGRENAGHNRPNPPGHERNQNNGPRGRANN